MTETTAFMIGGRESEDLEELDGKDKPSAG